MQIRPEVIPLQKQICSKENTMKFLKLFYQETQEIEGSWFKAGADVEIEKGDDITEVQANLIAQVESMLPLPSGDKSDDLKDEPKETKKAPVKKATKKKAVKKATPKKPKVVTYDNDKKELKKHLTDYLDSAYEGWTEDSEFLVILKDKAPSLTGEDLLDSEGNILESFTNAVDKLFE